VKDKPGTMICNNNHKVSITAGTSMHLTKLPLSTWFQAAWLITTLKPGVSALQLQRQLGLTRFETAWMLLHKLRGGLVAPEREKLSDTGCDNETHTDHWVEIDEVLVGGENRGRGHEAMMDNKSVVLVAVEVHEWYGEGDERDMQDRGGRGKKGKDGMHTRAGRCRMHVVPNRTGKTVAAFVQANVSPGSTIWTDDNPSYNLTARKGYPRRITIAKEDSDPLPTLGRVVTNLKRWLIGTHKGTVEPQHLQAYLNEFVFRFNRRDIPWTAFNRALGLCALDRPAVEYEALQEGRWVHPNPTRGIRGTGG